MKYELCMTDEYGNTSIIASDSDMKKLEKEAKKIVNDLNVNNPLTAEEKRRNWEVYYVELVSPEGELIEDAFYAGKNSKGQHVAQTEGGEFVLMDDIDGKIRVFAGILNREEWYGETLERKPINDIKHPFLASKSVYYIRKQKG